MNLLALDTSTQWAALAIARADGHCWVSPIEPGPRHGRALLPAIRDLLRQSDLNAKDLNAIAVGLGPGSYTGLRIGLTASKVLAYATGCTLLTLDSLAVIARNAPEEARKVSVIVDAQRGDLYAEDFQRLEPGGPLVVVEPVRVVSAQNWATEDRSDSLVLCPDLDRISRQIALPESFEPPEQGRPQGLPLLELAREVYQSGRFADPWFLEPIYLRRSAAEENWEARKVANG